MHRKAVSGVLALMLLVLPACTGGAIEPIDFPALTTGSTTPNTTEGPAATTPTVTATTLPPLDPPTFESLNGLHTVSNFTRSFGARGLARWERSVPGVEDVRIISTVDGAEQPALWVAPRGDRDRPLLVVLHSWSSPYEQHAGIPFAMWAQENGWAVIAPQFRGINNHPEAMGSDLAVQDVVDAIDYATSQDGVVDGIDHATSQDGVDPDRVYAVGLSGGGMMALLLAGRHPDRVAAVAAWSPVHDLVAFYDQSRAAGSHYWGQIRSVCGGDPRSSGPAQDECLRRSPSTYLDAAREEGVPVYIGQGIGDTLARPSNGANAFNQLANPEDRLSAEEVEEIGRRRVPGHLSEPVTTEAYFVEGDPAVVFARQSGAVWFVLFQGNHDMVYAPALRWFATDPH